MIMLAYGKIAALSIFKGLVMASVVLAFGIVFWQALIIASVSAGLTSLGVIAAALITRTEQQATRDEVREVKQAVGADKRKTDKPPGDHKH